MGPQSDALRAFGKIPILSGLSDEEVFDFIRACRVQRIAALDALFEQGDDGRSMYVIGEGAVDVYLERPTGRELVARFGAYDVIGELALLDPAPRSATAIATTETTVYEVRGEDFDALLRANHPAAFKIVRGLSRLVCRRIRSVNGRIEAELRGEAPPAPHTGEFERMRTGSRPAVTTGARPVVHSGTGARPAVRGSATGPAQAVPGKAAGRPSGMIRRVLSKFWKDES